MSTANGNHDELNLLSRRYHSTLKTHLNAGAREDFRLARRLGCQAIRMGLDTLDVARIHEHALLKLALPREPSATENAAVRRAGAFFAAAIMPLERTHRTALEAGRQFKQLRQRLHRRSAELAASKRKLKAELAHRKAAEKALRKSEEHYGRSLEQSRYMQDQLRRLSRQLLSAHEEERKTISRELHDVVAQALTSINVRLLALKRKAALNASGLERSVARTQTLVERSVNIVHRFARELRPAVLDDLGLIPALHTYLKHFRAETGIRVSLSAFAAVERVGGERRTLLYRVAQEALTNIARHARATEAEVNLERTGRQVCMTINDNGKGFDPDRVLQGRTRNRLGLLGMRERVRMLGGSFTLTSVPGKGTTVLARIPLDAGSAASPPKKRA